VATTDPRGIVTWANAAYAQLSGCTLDELLGKPAGDFPFEELLQAPPGASPWQGRAGGKRNTNEVCSIELTVTTLRNSAEEVTGFWVTRRDITGRKPDAPVPYNPEANLSALIESTEDLIGSFDLEYRLLTFNQALNANINWNMDIQAVVGMRLEEWLPPERYALWPPMFDRALAEGPFRTEYTLLDGRTLELSFNPILVDGMPTGISVFGKNITEQKRSEEARRQAEKEYRDIFEGAVEGIYRVSLEGKSLTANPALARMLGYESAAEGVPAITDAAHQIWLHPEERSAFLKLVQQQGVVLGYECQFKRKDGTVVWVSLKSRIVKDVDGTALYTEGFVEDITERKCAEEALRKANEAIAEAAANLSALIESTDDLIWSVDLQFGLLTFNDAYRNAIQSTFGIQPRVGMRPEDHPVPNRAARWRPMYERALAEGPYRVEDSLTENRTLELSLNPILRNGEAVGISVFGKDITDRKDAEARLQAQHERFRKIVENADAGYFRVGMDGRYEDVNPAFLRMHGFTSKEEAIGLHYSAVLNPENAAKAIDIGRALLRGESVSSGELSRIRRDGTIGYGCFSATPELDGDRVIAIEGFLIDITESKMAARKVEELQEVVSAAQSAAKFGVFQWNVKSGTNKWYPETFHLFGLEPTATDPSLDVWVQMIHPDDLDRILAELQQTLASPEGRLNIEYRLADGQRWISSSGQLYCDPAGQPDHVAGINIDITERKRSEEALRKSEEKFATVFRCSPAVVVLAEVAGGDRIVDVNEAFEDATGYSRDEAIGRTSNELGLWAEPAQFTETVERIRSAGHLRNFEFQFRRKNGDIGTALMSSDLVDLDGKQYVLSASSDITKQKRAEEALRRASEALAKAEAHYRLMFNSGSDAVLVHTFDENGQPARFFEVNDNACRLLGYTREELLRMGPADIIAPEERADMALRARRILAVGNLIWEGSHVTKDGRRIPVEVNTHLVDLEGLRTVISAVRDISERKEAETKYRDTFEGALEGIYQVTPEGRCLAANPAMAKMLGYDRPEEVLSAINDAARQVWLHPEERQRYLALLEEHGSIRDFECQFRRKDGTPFSVSISARKISGADGRTLYHAGFIADITERKRAEENVKTSESKFRTAFMTGADALVIATLEEGLILDVNSRFTEVFGYAAGEARGTTSIELGFVAGADRLRLLSELESQGHVTDLEFSVRRKNGEHRSVLISANVLRGESGDLLLCAIRDITERKQAEAGMRTLITAIEQTSETIVITDLDGKIQYCNPAFEKTTGYSKQEVIGQNPRVLKSGKHDKKFYEDMWAAITQGQVWSGHLTNRKKDGSFYEENATISPIRDESGRTFGFVAVKRDVTDRLELESQLRQAQKLESIGRLAGGVAHDFNNLLTVINGYSGLLLKGLKASDPLRSYADEIKTAGQRAASLTKQLLAFSRKQLIEPKVLDLNATIRESTPMLQRLIGEDISLRTHLEGSSGQILADADQIHQVIMNLAVNARDAMPGGGTLDIATRNVEIDVATGASMHHDATPGRYVLLTVTDNGQGMEEAIRRQIFEPFFTTKELGKGTGLGLATVYGIVRQSGGWIDVQSEVDVGTSFKVYLPRTGGSPGPEQVEMFAAAEGGSETILVVEDQDVVRTFAVTALRRFGYNVLEASDGTEALAVAARHPGKLHLLVTDVVMPGMNGKQLSERLTELNPTLEVIFVSGYTADVIADRGVLDPSVAFLHKPFSPEELATKVRSVLGNSKSPGAE
jgi:PAS domain S-box-containing protein